MAEFKPFRLSEAIGDAQNLASNTLRLGEMGQQVRARESLTDAMQAGTPEAMQSYRREFPVEASRFDATQAQANLQKMRLMGQRADFMGRLAFGVKDEATYQNALRQAKESGIDVSGAPPNYDPNYVKQFSDQAFSMKDRITQAAKQAELEIKREQLKESVRHNKALEGIKKDRTAREEDRSKPAHMGAVRRAAADALGLQVDTTGRLIGNVPEDNLLKHNKMAADAQRYYLNNPGVSPAEAVEAVRNKPATGQPVKATEPPNDRKKGQVYDTPKGPMTWTGSGWTPAN